MMPQPSERFMGAPLSDAVSATCRPKLDAVAPAGQNRSSGFFEVRMLSYLFVLVAIAVRFMPHPLAFTPVGAALLFFGARGPKRQWWVPLVLLAASDVILTKLV